MTMEDFIEHLSKVDQPESPVKFDMDKTALHRQSTLRGCGSACCIGGHASLLLDKLFDEPAWALAELTGIPHWQANAICWPDVSEDINPYGATLEQAINLLKHYVKTGEVDWPRALGVE